MSTPASIATKLQAAGWRPVGDDDWIRPGAHPDRHSWPIADLVRRTNEPHHVPPPAVAPKPPKPGFSFRRGKGPLPHARVQAGAESAETRAFSQSNHEPRAGQPRKLDLISKVVHMRDVQRMTFAAISSAIGGSTGRIHYLYSQRSKLTPARVSV